MGYAADGEVGKGHFLMIKQKEPVEFVRNM